eukprot:SAG11_NODE_384_length_9897_cov_11.158502_6_plen_236_part_00
MLTDAAAAAASGGVDESRHGFMQYILCCELGTTDALRAQGRLRFAVDEAPQAGEWIHAAGAYNSWGAAVDFCVAHGAEDLCPLETYCPNGAGMAPYGGRRSGRNGDDQWAPYGGDGDNRWVQTGTWCVAEPCMLTGSFHRHRARKNQLARTAERLKDGERLAIGISEVGGLPATAHWCVMLLQAWPPRQRVPGAPHADRQQPWMGRRRRERGCGGVHGLGALLRRDDGKRANDVV